jgi:hypothetical protein
MLEYKNNVRAATRAGSEPDQEARRWIRNDDDCGEGCVRSGGMLIGPYQSFPEVDPDSRTKDVCVKGIAGVLAFKVCTPGE